MGIEDILKGSDPKEIKKLIALLQSVVDTVDSTADHSSEPDIKENESSSTMKTRSRKLSSDTNKSKKTFKNKFLTMPEKNMHKEDIEFDKKVIRHDPVPRTRSFEPVSVTCRVCGKTEKINPVLVESRQRYKCNQCSTQAG